LKRETKSAAEVEEPLLLARETTVSILLKARTEGGPCDQEQFIEQLDGVVEADASRAEAVGDEALQLQAPVAGGSRVARHVRVRTYGGAAASASSAPSAYCISLRGRCGGSTAWHWEVQRAQRCGEG
jgi:hypothetical protein